MMERPLSVFSALFQPCNVVFIGGGGVTAVLFCFRVSCLCCPFSSIPISHRIEFLFTVVIDKMIQ